MTVRLSINGVDADPVTVNAKAVPRVGERICLQQGEGLDAIQTEWRVKDVEYLLREGEQDPSDTVFLYVEKADDDVSL